MDELQRLMAIHKSKHIVSAIMIAKGLIGPGDIRQGGAITPERARRFISLVFAEAFLQKCTRDVMVSLKKEGAVIDIPQDSLRDVPQGELPSNDDKASLSNYNYILEAKPAQLFVDIKKDFWRDNQDNPSLATDLETSFSNRVRGELVNLAWRGTGVTDDGPFLKLNKGFIQIAKDGAPSDQRLTINPEANGWVAELGRMLLALPEQFHTGAVFHMNTKDAIEYGLEVAQHVTGLPQVAANAVGALLNYPIESLAAIPRGKVLLAQQPNLVFGVNQDIERTVEVKGRERVTWYTWDMNVDFEIAAKAGVVLGQKA